MDMNPLDKIREGVEKQDWGLVCEGYNAMTGHNLSSPTELDSDSVTDKSAIQLFKSHILRMVEEFELPILTDEQDTEDYVVETCDVSQPISDDDVAQPADDDEENVEFDAVTESVEKVGLFGNPTVLITEKPTAKQVETNKERDAAREEPKVPRPPPKTYEVKCTDCEKPFDSRVKTGEFGQKCPKCLRSMRRDRQ